ncbi:hypothetical protein PV419_00105 [Streptomyces sp. ME19-01-6]|nr:hypothetical protein [Streptomyces sp. ME19-01-6]
MPLAERCGLARLAVEKVRLSKAENGPGAADAKVASIMDGMVAGADSIDDLNLLRHGAIPAVSREAHAPCTLGMCLRAFTHGHALQLHVHRKLPGELATHTPLLPGAPIFTALKSYTL